VTGVFGRVAGVALLLAGLTLSMNASAHRMPLGMTTVTHNQATDSVEIVHRLHRHDAEQAMVKVMAEAGVDLQQLAVQARLALYVEAHFQVAAVVNGAVDDALPLQLLGVELDGDYVLVYQELSGSLPGEIAIRNDVLRDLFPNQVNQVNITTAAGVKTLVFKRDDDWHRLVLQQD
jgi:hypothetical protein